jgi:hypothetical protein
MKKACAFTFVAVVSCAVAGAAAAQPAAEAGIAECATIESAVARLDCFDALARRTHAASPGNEARVAPAESAPGAHAPTSRAAEPEGVVTVPPAAREPAAPPSRREARAGVSAEDEQVSQVAALREIQPGRLEVTLTNGQVWRQTNSDRYNLVVGHDVRLYRSGFGGTRLSSLQARGFIQVERVR